MRATTYYGWWIVVAWVILNIYWAGTLNYGLTVFFTPVRLTFGWDATVMALVFSQTNVLAGLLSPLTGALFDRIGPRPLMLTASGCAGIGMLALGLVTSPAGFVIAFTVVSVGYGIWMGMGLATIGLWFRRRRGLAMGIITAGSAIGGLLVAILQYLIVTTGWRGTFLIAGAGMLFVGTLSSLLLRHRPAELGLAPDGDPLPVQEIANSADFPAGWRSLDRDEPEQALRRSDGNLGFWAAMRSWQFWILSAITTTILAGSTAATVLLLPRLAEAGVAPGVAVSAATFSIVLGVVGRPGSGWLADRIPMHWLMVILISVQAIGLVAFATALNQFLTLAIFVIAFGLSNDVIRMLASILIVRFYGPRAFGRILGIHYFVLIPGRALGPVLAGVLHDRGYGYGPPFLVVATLSLVMVLPAWLLRAPRATPE